MHAREVKYANDCYIVVNHNSDWSGDAICIWRDGDRKGEFKCPAVLMRTLLDGSTWNKYDDLLSRLRDLVDEESR